MPWRLYTSSQKTVGLSWAPLGQDDIWEFINSIKTVLKIKTTQTRSYSIPEQNIELKTKHSSMQNRVEAKATRLRQALQSTDARKYKHDLWML